MKEKIRIKGQLNGYAKWPLLMSVLLLIMNICMYPISVKAGLLMSGFLVIYIFIVVVLYLFHIFHTNSGGLVLKKPPANAGGLKNQSIT